METEEIKNIFALNLKHYMKEFDYNNVTLAKDLGCWDTAISKWLNEKREPSLTYLWKMSDLFNCTIDELVGKTY